MNAARSALEDAGMLPEELQMIIVATVTPDLTLPATASFVQDRLGAVVDHEGVGESAPLDLVLRLLAATLLEIDPEAHAVRPGRGVVGQENAVAAADLDLQPASGGCCQRRPQHPPTNACRVRI